MLYAVFSLAVVVACGQVPLSYRPIAWGGQILIVCQDGTVQGWGHNSYAVAGGDPYKWAPWEVRYTPQPVTGLRDVVQVAVGSGPPYEDGSHPSIPWPRIFSLALRRDGTLWGWGFTRGMGALAEADGGALEPVHIAQQLNDIVQISAAGHVAVLRRDGTVWTWGANDEGQLGDGTRRSSSVPRQVGSIDSVIQVEAGAVGYTFAVRADGTVWYWGKPPGARINRWLPQRIEGLNNITAVTGMWGIIFALRRDGTVWQVRAADSGFTQPEPLEGLSQIVTIAGSDTHVLALRRDSTLWGWGSNRAGCLGVGQEGSFYATAVRIPLDGVVAIGVGRITSYAIRRDGTLWSWGANSDGSLGLGESGKDVKYVATPTQVPGICAVADVKRLEGSCTLKVIPTVTTDGGVLLDGSLNAPVEVSLVSALGAIVRQERLEQLPAWIALTDVPAGVYGIVIRTDNKQWMEKIVLLR